MHISEVLIHNFRNFEHTTINLNQGFQTIIGENNIGKSNLFYAIRLVLDRELSYKARRLDLKDFHGYASILNSINDYILISIEFIGNNLAALRNFHPLKISENKIRVTYIFAHKQKFELLENSLEGITEGDSEPDDEAAAVEEMDIEGMNIDDFTWKIYGGPGDKIEDFGDRTPIHMQELEGINLYYIKDFRNIYRDISGNSNSLLSKYCFSRENYNEEFGAIKDILEASTEELNNLEFIPNISAEIINKSKEIVGNYFSVPISLGFSSSFDTEVWDEMKLYYNLTGDKPLPVDILGLGQKNVLYLTLFIAALENHRNPDQINILLIEEPEAHLHPQLQKILFHKLRQITSTQVLMTSHSTHIASDCEYKNICVIYKKMDNKVKAFSPFINTDLANNETKLLKRYLDATRSELFFSSAVILVEGIAEQFIIPAICKFKYGINLTEYNISVIPIHGRHFVPFLKLFQNNKLEIPVAVIIDGDDGEIDDEDEVTTTVQNARNLEVENRVRVFSGEKTLEIDLFPININSQYLRDTFINLGHDRSYANLINTAPNNWDNELISRIDRTVSKGRFAQELSTLINSDFVVAEYIDQAIRFIANTRGIEIHE